MDLELTEIETRWQRQAENFCAATPRSAASGMAVSELYAQAREAGLCGGFSFDNTFSVLTDGIALFLAIEELARHEPELAFAVAYHCLCGSVASVLFEGGPCRPAIRHSSSASSPFDTLLVWPCSEPGVSITGILSEMDTQNKQLKIADPLQPLPCAEDVFFLGWAHSGPGSATAFWIPAAHGQKRTDKPVCCVGLNGISFRQIEWEAKLDNGSFITPIRDLPQKYLLLDWERTVLYGAVLSGLLQALLNYAVDYSRKRKTFGKPILLHQAVAMNLADMKVEVEATRLVLLEMMQSLCRSQLVDHGAHFRQYLSDAALQVSTQALQVLGGHGLLHDHPVEKWVRDVQAIRSFLA